MFGVCLMDASESFHTLHICMCMSLGRGKYVCVANWNWMHIHYYVDQARGTKSLFVCVFMWCMHEGFHTLHTTTHHHHGVCHRPTETCKLALWNGRLLFFFCAHRIFVDVYVCAHYSYDGTIAFALNSTTPHHHHCAHSGCAHTKHNARLIVCVPVTVYMAWKKLFRIINIIADKFSSIQTLRRDVHTRRHSTTRNCDDDDYGAIFNGLMPCFHHTNTHTHTSSATRTGKAFSRRRGRKSHCASQRSIVIIHRRSRRCRRRRCVVVYAVVVEPSEKSEISKRHQSVAR